MSSVLQGMPGRGRHEVVAGLAAALAMHVVAAWLLLHQAVATPEQAPRVISVSLLAAPATTAAPATPPPDTPVAVTPEPTPAPTRTRATPTRKPVAVKRAPSPWPDAAKPQPIQTAAAPSASPTASAPPRPATLVPPAGEEPVTVAPGFDAAYLNNPAPPYPPLSRRLGEQGRVLVRVFVDPGGAPTQVQLRQSSGHRRLDSAAEAAVRRWRFVPARRGDEPIGAWVLVPISFNLRS